MQYNITVIGNDEAAFEMLCLAAESEARTAAVLPESCQSSWLVGLALKRLVADLLVDQSPHRQRLLRRTGSPRLIRRLVASAIARETEELVGMLERLNIDVHMGQPRFVDRQHITIADGRSCRRSQLSARHFVIGTGTRVTAMHRPLGLVALHRPETIFDGLTLPQSICVLGGDSFGCGIAALFSLFGVNSRHVARDTQDSSMLELAHAAGVEIGCHPSEFGLTQSAGVLSNEHTDVIDCRRSVGFTESLNLSAIDVEADENGQLWCSSELETWCPGIFGIGDVVGFSADIAVPPTVQAERIQRRLRRQIPRPHLLDVFVSGHSGERTTRRSPFSAVNN